MKKLFLLFSLLLRLSVSGVLGQGTAVYPVQVNVSLIAPYSLYLSDYVSGSRDRLLVTLINRDARYRSMPVRLRLTVKGNGFTVQTRPYASVSPLTLEPNLPYRLTVDDLRPYFDSRNLSSQGLGGDSFLKGKRMPEGMVEFCVEVLEYNTGKLLSRKGVGTAWLALQKPPLLSLPFNGETLSWREPLNQLFQWTPQSPGTARVEYELIIKELWDNGMAPESAFAYSPEVFRERIPATSYLYGVQAPPLEAGHRYAWAVRVVPKDDADDDNILENDGLSEIRSFRVGRYCPPPTNIKATAERGYIRVDWEGMPEHLRYAVSYRLQGSEEWHDEYSSFPSAMLSGIRAGNTYEYRVAGFCDADVPTYNDHVGKINVPLEDTARLRNCGILRPVDLSNQEPLELLRDGDQFMAGDFPVHIQEVRGSQGYFTGYGYVHIPFLANAPFKVTFDNIFINTDRRMIRGVVKTVYDETESGMLNLNDIFVGGDETGKVKEGITKTDLSASFAIDPGADFYFDESTGRIEMTDEDGQVIGYVEIGNGVMEEGLSAGDNGNEPSVFPMTVKDSTGNIYQIEEAPEETPSQSLADVSPSNKKKLVVKPLGKTGDSLAPEYVNLKRLDNHVAEVVFADAEGSSYAFDEWRSVYPKSYLINPKYEQLGMNYYVPAKLLPAGKSDKVAAILKIHDASVDPTRVVFKTQKGTEFKPERYDASTGQYLLALVGGEADDAQELYALYPKPGGGYYNLGKLLIVTYKPYRIKVKIVPVANDLTEFEALRHELQKIYGRVGIECIVEKMPVFSYNAPLLFKEKSGIFSAYNTEMKALNEAYVSSVGIDSESSYLFVLLYSGQGRDRNYSGFMPLNKQFGYLFRKDFNSFEEFATAAAHELAHGRLSLKHPFDKSLGLSEGDLPDNLMDYRGGRELAKWQWDVIHDPGVVVRMFERDEDEMMQIFNDPICVQKVLECFRAAYVNQCKFTYPANSWPAWGHSCRNTTFSDGNTYSYVSVNVFQDMDLIPFEFEKKITKQYRYGKNMIIDVEDKITEFHKYLFPSREEWNKQIENLISRINTEKDRKQLIRMLAILPLSEYSRFSGLQICRIIEILSRGSLTEGWISCVDEEEMLLTLLKNIRLSDRKQFLDFFESDIISLLKKLDGENRKEAIWLLSDFIHSSFGGNRNTVTQYRLRSDGSAYNHVFRWSETMGADPLYDFNLSSTSNKILVSVRNDWWFSDSKYLMELSPYDFVGVELESDLKYTLPPSYPGGDFLVMPALLFHWLCEERNSDEAWQRFCQSVDFGFTLATVGTYGAAKTALQVGTTYTLGMSLDYMIRLGINSLVEDDFMKVVEETPLLDANWDAATIFISNTKRFVVLNLSRNFLKRVIVNKEAFDESLESGIKELLVFVIINGLIDKSSRYAIFIMNALNKNSRVVIAKLRNYGVDKESIIELTKLLLDVSSQEAIRVLEEINLIYEEKK